MIRYLAQFARAIFAGIVAGLGAMSAVLVGSVGFTDITAGQWVTIVLAALIAAGGVFGITNVKPSAP